jgi:hypothetical protein
MLPHPLAKAHKQLWLRQCRRVWQDDDTDSLEISQKRVGATAIPPGSALESGAPASRDMAFEILGVTYV